MTITAFVQEIKEQCAFLESDGYVFHHQPNRVWYTKTNQIVISFNYLVYDFIDVYGLTASKRFDVIEDALQLKDSYTILTQLDGADFPGRLPTKNNYHFEISDSTHVAAYASLIADFYKEKVLPFFETYATASAVNEWIASKPVTEHQNMLSSDEDAMVLRRIMIMYHAGDKGYAELLGKYKAFLETRGNESPFNTIYQHLVEMEKTLK
jgi:hypothetical protein